MSGRVPRIREDIDIDGQWVALVREGLSIAFYMRQPHELMAPAVLRALERYRQAISPRQPGWYVDSSGDWQPVDAAGEAVVRQRLLATSALVDLIERPDSVTGVAFKYQGRSKAVAGFENEDRESTCALEFRLPIEFLDERGPEWIRSFAIDLGSELPWSSGHAGLSLEVGAWPRTLTPRLREVTRRHPGFDLNRLGSLSLYLGTKLRPPAWLNFLGPPVLNELGGAEGLRSRLHSPSTQVESLSPDRAVVSLGPVPEAGDLEAGDTLPAYRELARVLEPWLYAHKGSWGDLTEAEVRQWERRFL
ncbi:type VI immunity family protein [Corallococcus sp. AB038B]|uniref:type VI immunity family protein n=1 Tax=Corallococcus sp. AB038B TaxID=2316718 RepID=UPI0018F43001|nr:type VI immunity family protein [Corallococcus sp. AB038B]